MNFDHENRQCTHDWLPLRSVTGATPAYSMALVTARSCPRSPSTSSWYGAMTLLQRVRDPVGQPNPIFDQLPPSHHHRAQGPHVRAVRLQLRQLLPELQGQAGVRRIVLRSARRERLPVLRQRQRVHGEQHEDVVLQQGRDDRSLRELQADGHLAPPEPLPQALRPLLDGRRPVLQDRRLYHLRSRRHQAHVVLAVRPVDAHERRELRIGRGLLANCDLTA
jgi:hypothetical protein